MHKAPRRLGLRPAPAKPELTPSNCSRSPRLWSRPCRSRRWFPRRGASSRRRRHGAQPGRSHGRRAGRSALPACLFPPSLPPWARAGTAPAAARSAPRGSFPRRSPAPPQEQAPATPPRAGGATSPASRAQILTAPEGTASSGSEWPRLAGAKGRVRSRPNLPRGSGGGVGTRPYTWGRGAARGQGETAVSGSARLLSLSGEACRRGRGRAGAGRALGPRGLALLLAPPSAGQVSILCLKNNPKRVAECERVCVTSRGAVAKHSLPTRLSLVWTQTAEWLTLAVTFAL